MKCPVCNRDVVGKSCSYCGTVIELESVDKEKQKELYKNKRIFYLLIACNIIFVILPIFFYYLTIVSVALMIVSILFLSKNIKPLINKSKYVLYLVLVICLGALSFIPFSEKMADLYLARNAYSKYSELVDVTLPNYNAKKEYISSLDKGYRIERFTYLLTDEEIEVLINSNTNFEAISSNSEENKVIFNIWYNDIKSGYYIIYNMLDENYEDVKDYTLYHYCVIIVKDDNTVIVDEITKTPTEVSS